MSDQQTPGGGPDGGNAAEPFRESGSGEDYDPAASWGAERRLDGPSGGTVPGMQGAPSGAGDGGFGPEGDYTGPAGRPNANVLGEVNGSPDQLIERAQELGRPKPDREWIGGNPPDDGL